MKQAAGTIVLHSIFLFVVCANLACNKTGKDGQKPKADFSFALKNPGLLPDTATFTSTSTGASSLLWSLGNGDTSTATSPQAVYTTAGTYTIKLVATNQYGSDSLIRQVAIVLDKPKPSFTYTVRNQGFLPDTVDFSSLTTNYTSLKWDFGDGSSDTASRPRHVYTTHGSFQVKLVATNAAGSDSVTNTVAIQLNKPKAGFSFTVSRWDAVPVVLRCTNQSTGSAVSYTWTFGNGNTSTQPSPVNNYTAGGIYTIKLVVKNASGSDSISKEVRISPYLQAYRSINGSNLNLYAWEGEKVMILSRNGALNRSTMFKWVTAMDTTYNYYKACTGREPNQYAPTYINNRTTIADVPATCGAGCGFIGFTGFELQNDFFDIDYREINNQNRFHHLCFYEFGRNFWFYSSKLDYKEAGSFPIAGAFAVWMGSIEGRDAIGVAGDADFIAAKARFANYLTLYLANPSLNWSNTLAVDKGVPGHCNAADLFTSMCMRLKQDYGGNNFLQNIWKNVALRPDAKNTQDAVDNFFLAACKTANRNLTTLFQSWRWPLSAGAVSTATQYP